MMKKYRKLIRYYLFMVLIICFMGIISLRMIHQMVYSRMVDERKQELVNFGKEYNERIDQISQTINDLYYFPDIVWMMTKSDFQPQDYLRLKSVEHLIHMTNLQSSWIAGYGLYFASSNLFIDQSRIYMSTSEAYPAFFQVSDYSCDEFIKKYMGPDDGFYPEETLIIDGKKSTVIPYTQRINRSNGLVATVFFDVEKMEEAMGAAGSLYSIEYNGKILREHRSESGTKKEKLFLNSQEEEYGLSFHSAILDQDLQKMQRQILQRYLLLLLAVTSVGIVALITSDLHFNRSVRELAGEYESQKQAVNHFYMNRLLDGLSSEKEVEKAGEYYQMDPKLYSMAAILVSSDEMIQMVADQLFQSFQHPVLYIIKHGYRAEIIFYNLKDPNQLIQDTIEKLSTLSVDTDVRPFIAFGNPYKLLRGISVSWMEARKTMRYRRKYPQSNVSCYNQLPMSKDIVALDVDAKKKMQVLLTSGEIEKARQQFLEIYEKQYCKELILNPVMANNFTAQIANVFLYAIETTVTDSNNKEALMLQVAYLFSESDKKGLEQQILELIDKIGSYSKQPEKDQNKQGQRMLEYIDQNYQDPDLSLQQMGEIFHMNYGYFSQYFKQHTGKNFSQYLEKIRMEKAIELLENGKTVTETMEAVGYLNRNTFYKAFTRVHGLSPKAYKEWKQNQQML